MPMNSMLTAHLVLPAAIHRIKMLEERMAGQDAQITQLAGMIARAKEDGGQGQIDKLASIIDNIRLTIPLKTISQHIQGGHSPLEIPKELLPTVGKYRTRSNRTYEVVKKRWALWKTQLDSGVTPSELAKAWGCDRGTILYAIKNKFTARASNGRKLVRYPKSRHSAIRSKQRNPNDFTF